MWKDPIVEEIHRFREELAARFNFDMHAICEHLRKRQQDDTREVVTLPPKRIDSKPVTKSQPAA